MRDDQGANCDGHPYTPELGKKLRKAFETLGKMAEPKGGRTWVNVVPFSDQPFYNILLHRKDSNLAAVKEFWGAVRDSEAPKVFVGPERLKPAADMLKAEFVEIPLINAFAEYGEIRAKLMWKAKPGTIFIFCAGMPAKAWVASLLEKEPNMSCLDAGSCWDPLFVDQPTRTEQLSQDVLQREYAEWLA